MRPEGLLLGISIHAPREGGDRRLVQVPLGPRDFNPRPPRGGRPPSTGSWCRRYRFQSTPPARGATLHGRAVHLSLHISIHAPREGGDKVAVRTGRTAGISIHAPREGGDLSANLCTPKPPNFNPRPPRGGRRRSVATLGVRRLNFNPRPPRGGRRADGQCQNSGH